MTCTECLRLVAIADVVELRTAAAVTEHCQTCPDCATVVDAVAEEACRLADTLDGMPPGVPAHVVALRAVAGAGCDRRRSRALRITASVLALTIGPLAALALLRTVVPPPVMETRTVELRCLGPEQALELARPTLPAGIRATARPATRLPIVTLQGAHRDLAMAEQLIAQLDARWGAERSEYCARPPASTPEPAPGPRR